MKECTRLDHGGAVLEFARRNGIDYREFLDFSASINPLGPPEELLELIRKNLDVLACYPENCNEGLVRALGAHCGVRPANILAGNGATELIYFLLSYLKPRSSLVALPTFSEFPRACAIMGTRIEAVPFIHLEAGGFRFDSGVLLEALKRSAVDLVILVHPNNPTGALLERTLIDELLRETRERNTSVLLDESFIDFVPGQTAINRLEANPHVFLLRSLTKFYAIPGLRLGYLVADAARVREMLEMRQPWQVNQLAQLAGELCPTLAGYGAQTLELIRQERAWLEHQLAAIAGLVSYPGAANFLLVRLDPTIGSVREIHNRLLQHRILIRRCDGWPGLPDNCFRIAVRSRKENELLIERLKKCL
jgi:threonine-phosphate decarboxylase